jgi:hypothetical protein
MKWRLDDGQIEVVDDAVVEALRRMTPAERVAKVFDCNRTMRLVIEGYLRTRHPEWDDVQIRSEVRRRMTRGSA